MKGIKCMKIYEIYDEEINLIVDTTTGCSVLHCSRKNLAYMVRQKQLQPIKEDEGNLYLKKDLLGKLW